MPIIAALRRASESIERSTAVLGPPLASTSNAGGSPRPSLAMAVANANANAIANVNAGPGPVALLARSLRQPPQDLPSPSVSSPPIHAEPAPAPWAAQAAHAAIRAGGGLMASADGHAQVVSEWGLPPCFSRPSRRVKECLPVYVCAPTCVGVWVRVHVWVWIWVWVRVSVCL